MTTNNVSTVSVAKHLPEYLAKETEYAELKYGVQNNPQHTIFYSGLDQGGEAYQEYFRYFGAWKLFTLQSKGESRALLLASQASIKFLNVSRATLCFALISQLDLSLSDSNKMALDMLSTELEFLDEIDIIDSPAFEIFENEILEPTLSDMALVAHHGNEPEFIPLVLGLFKSQASLVIGHIASHRQIAIPGMPSGEVAVLNIP